MKKFYYNLVLTLVAAIVAVGCTEDITTDNFVVNNDANCEMIEVVADLELFEESRTTLIDGGHCNDFFYRFTSTFSFLVWVNCIMLTSCFLFFLFVMLCGFSCK